MHRRNLVTLLGGVILAPLARRAQQKAVRVIGVLDTKGTNSNPDPELLSGMSIGLAETGYTDGQNVVVKSFCAASRARPTAI